MYERVDKPNKNTSRVVDNAIAQKQNPLNQSFGFVDNRLDAIAQKKYQDMVSISQQKNNNVELQTAQLKKTNIKHTAGTINVNGSDQVVGKIMKAELNPKDPVVGSGTGVNSEWMKWIRSQYPDANVVRGHLLNHDLGGFAVEENLYPISTLANANHSSKVEQNVKSALSWADQVNDRWVEYNVAVNESNSYMDSQFVCNWVAHHSDDSEFMRDQQTIDSNLSIDKGGFGGGKKEKQSPVAWRHGKSKGDRKVEAVRIRLEKAIKDEKVVFESESMMPENESMITDDDGCFDFLHQDAVEWLFDMVEMFGISDTWFALFDMSLNEDKEKICNKLMKILEAEPEGNWD